MPEPVKEITCGLPAALSEIETLPVLVPTAVGVKVTLIVQFEPDDTLDAQVFVWEKSPVVLRLKMERAALPTF